MKFLGILLLVCPLMAQIGSTGPVASDSANVSSVAAPAMLFSGSGAVKMDGELKNRQFYRWSVMAIVAGSSLGQQASRWPAMLLVAGNAADALSSWHHPEANPVLAHPGAAFDMRSVALKAGFLGGSLLIEHWALSHNPRLYRRLAWMNVAIAGGLGGVAMYNTSLH